MIVSTVPYLVKKMFLIGISIATSTIASILQWFILSWIISPSLLLGLGYFYPLGCLLSFPYYIVVTGACIDSHMQNDYNRMQSGYYAGTILQLGLLILGCVYSKEYLAYVGASSAWNNVYYYILITESFTWSLTCYSTVLNYSEKCKQSALLMIGYQALILVVVTITGLIFKTEEIIFVISTCIMFIAYIYLIKSSFKKCKIELHILKWLKIRLLPLYSLACICILDAMLWHKCSEAGSTLVAAATACDYITCFDWEFACSVNDVVRIEAAKKNFKFIKLLKASYIYNSSLAISIIILAVITLNTSIKLDTPFFIFDVGIQIACLLFTAQHMICSSYLVMYEKANVLLWAGLIIYTLRIIVSVLPNFWYVQIGQLVGDIVSFIIYNYLYRKLRKKKECLN